MSCQYTDSDPMEGVKGVPAIKAKDNKGGAGKGRKDGKDGAEAALNKFVIYAASKDYAIRELIHGQSRTKFETGGYQYA